MQHREMSWYRVLLTTPSAFWCVWIGINLALGIVALVGPGWPLGDVLGPYKVWSGTMFSGMVMGIDAPFVYPYVALLPMLLPWLAGDALYGIGWVVMSGLLNTAALGVLTNWGRVPGRMRFAWWWLVFLVCLGPVAIGRIDAVALGVTLIGLAYVLSRPRVSAALLAFATWIKIWPVAILLALIVSIRQRARVFWTALWTAIGIFVFAIALGGIGNVLSFVGEQGARALQVEATVATPWMVARLFNAPGIDVVYDNVLMTNVINASGSMLAAQIVATLMPIVVLSTLLLSVLAMRRGAVGHRVLPPLALALVTELIVFNKVGSPQFMCWFVAPALLYIVLQARQRKLVLTLMLVAGVLTQMIYPYLYVQFLSNDVPLVLIFAARNGLVVILWMIALGELTRLTWNAKHSAPKSQVALAQ